MAFCSPRRLARKDEEVEIFELVEYCDMLQEERVKVMEGCVCSGLGVRDELLWDWAMPHPPVASVNGGFEGGFGGGGGIWFLSSVCSRGR